MVRRVLEEGIQRGDRTGTGTISIFSHQMTFDMADGFPLLTTKDMTTSFNHVVGEMLWMLEGSTNANYLAERFGFSIWKRWAQNASGDLGPVYGHQWRNFDGEVIDGTFLTGTDQISWVMKELTENPTSRRMVVSSWNPNQLDKMALPPCHWSFELYVEKDTLNMKLHQRSCDVFLGVPYNIAEYALLLHMIANVADYVPGILIHDMTNVHIYNDHIPQMEEQIRRSTYKYYAPRLVIKDSPKGNRSIFDFRPEDFELQSYGHFPKLTGKVSV
jgi:thymidylate synthase